MAQSKINRPLEKFNSATNRPDDDFLAIIEKEIKVGFWKLNATTWIPWWSDRTCEIHGVPPGTQPTIEEALSHYYESDIVSISAAIQACIETGQKFNLELPFKQRSGKKIWIRTTGQVVLGRDGLIELVGIFEDITDRKELEIANQNYAHKLNQMIQSTPGVVFRFTTTPSGEFHFDYVSPAAHTFFGIDPENVLRSENAFADYVTPECLASLFNLIETSSKSLEPFDWEGHISNQFRKFWIHLRCVPKKNRDDSITWDGVAIDRTTQFEMEQELNLAREKSLLNERLASIGELAAGVGHEINNPLAIAKSSVQLIQRRLVSGINDPLKLTPHFDRFERATERISHIITSLKELATENDLAKQDVLDLNKVVQQNLALLMGIYKNQFGIRIEVKHSEQPIWILGNSANLSSMLNNLLTNSKEALVGELQPTIKISIEQAGAHALLKIADNGKGISQKIRPRIFDPFFSTKFQKNAVGMGLSRSSRIVAEHNGRILLNDSNDWTEFCIEIPTLKKNLNEASA